MNFVRHACIRIGIAGLHHCSDNNTPIRLQAPSRQLMQASLSNLPGHVSTGSVALCKPLDHLFHPRICSQTESIYPFLWSYYTTKRR